MTKDNVPAQDEEHSGGVRQSEFTGYICRLSERGWRKQTIPVNGEQSDVAVSTTSGGR